MEKEFYEELEKRITLVLSNDKMIAKTIVVILEEDDLVFKEQLKLFGKDILLKKIHEKNISYGIDENAINNLFSKGVYNTEIVIAKGLYPIRGEDGILKYHFNKTLTKSPKLLDNGTVDFHELDIIQNVTSGTLLVSYKPHIENQTGYDITGKPLKLSPVKKYAVPKGKNTKLSDDGLKLLADSDGNVEIIDGKVCVSQVFEVKNNVDLSTGDIYFRGDVLIRKNVITGFTVRATGSISVDGFVEAAYLYAGGDIFLKNGVQGANKGIIKAEGNIVAKFAESVNIYAKGDITIGAIMNSQIESEGNVIAQGKKGFIIGGTTYAHNKVECWALGNMAEIPTVVEVGFTKNKSERYLELKDLINKLAKDLESLDVGIIRNTGVRRLELMRKKIEKNAAYKNYIAEYSKLSYLRERESELTVQVHNNTYPKVSIYMGSFGITTSCIEKDAKFKLIKDGITNINL